MMIYNTLYCFILALFAIIIRYADSSSSSVETSSSLHDEHDVVTTTTTTSTCSSTINQTTMAETCSSESKQFDNMSSNDDNTFNSSIIFEWILLNDYISLDGNVLLNSIQILKERNAHQCWHKHSTFIDHLLNVQYILRLWGQSHIMGRIGLFHSAYSNSYVNLALFNVNTERTIMKKLIGNDAEEIVYLFCIINRQEVVVNYLLKLGYIPKDGMYVPHLKNINETVYLNSETIYQLLIFSMADISEQYFGWQDELFGNDGAMLLPNKDILEQHNPYAIWPGISKPGIWMTYVNQLAIVANTYTQPTNTNTTNHFIIHIPPIFDNCTKILLIDNEIKARDIYWNIIMNYDNNHNKKDNNNEQIINDLLLCIEYNPYIFEPFVILAQHYLHISEYTKAEKVTAAALTLQQQWGTSWDKRLPFNAWVAWTRVLHQRAVAKQSWPINSWDINNFGLVH